MLKSSEGRTGCWLSGYKALALQTWYNLSSILGTGVKVEGENQVYSGVF